MNRSFLTSSLAAAAVASAITLAAPSTAQAADRPCGQPAVAAAYTTVHHPAVTESHPAATHSEWLWQYTHVDQDAYTRYEWTRVLQEYGYTSYDWQRHVIDVPHVDAVTRVETDTTRSATQAPAGDGWSLTGESTDHPAVTHTRYQWSRTVIDTPYQAPYDEQVLDQAAYDDTVIVKAAWDEQVLVEAAYDEVVTDQPAWDEEVVAANGYAYVDKHGNVKYLDTPDWNGGDDDTHDIGWNRTPGLDLKATIHHDAVTHVVHHDATYTTVHHDAVTSVVHHDATYRTVHHDAVEEVSHPETEYTDNADSPGDDWSLVGQETIEDSPAYTDYVWKRTVVVSPEVAEEAHDEVRTTDQAVEPAGDGWELSGTTSNTQWSYVAPDTAEHPWAATGAAETPELFYNADPGSVPTGSGWAMTGNTWAIPATTSVVTSSGTSVAAPDADHGWTVVDGSEVTVTDRAASTVILTAAYDEHQLVTPAQPATPACGTTRGHTAATPAAGGTSATASATVAAAQAAAAPTAGTLPNTGNPATIGLAATGLGTLASGAVLMMLSRRRRFVQG